MPPFPTIRLADTESARRYPLPVTGPARWTRGRSGSELSLALPALTAGTLLVPSLALPREQTRDGLTPYRWVLESPAGRWPLPRVPSSRSLAVAPDTVSPGPVSTHIDCFCLQQPLTDAHLCLELAGPPPARYLLTVSARALQSGDDTPVVPPAHLVTLEQVPPARSQVTAPDDIALRICSPTCVSMVLDLWQRPHDWLTLVAGCLDPATRTYGVWPLAVAAAAGHGIAGAVEVFSDWDEPLRVLARGVPLVTSIRFQAGELPGAPLEATNGHLVVVHGAGPEFVDVCDPAAGPDAVRRRYPAPAFSRAWLRQRGAAYILPP